LLLIIAALSIDTLGRSLSRSSRKTLGIVQSQLGVMEGPASSGCAPKMTRLRPICCRLLFANLANLAKM